jgi:aromatic-L-amino-acid/L-tryptophan decarboxylase
VWINIDAAYLGSTWISPKFRPAKALLDYADSIDINFNKILLNGTGGSLFYIRDKRVITESFNDSSLAFHFYKNQYTGQNDVVDYKDWIVGLARRNNSLKIYYTFEHYGVKMIREAV